jgi:DNA-binding NarL/FixJ family response regulator
MTAVAFKRSQALRIGVLARDPASRENLEGLVRRLGFQVTDTPDAAVVISDGVTERVSAPVLVLGESGEVSHLPRDANLDQIEAALHALSLGLIVRMREPEGFGDSPDMDERALLTPREIEVLTAVSRGLTNKEIARELDISRHTVKFHLESLMRKLQVSSRAEAVSKSLRLKLLEPYRL